MKVKPIFLSDTAEDMFWLVQSFCCFLVLLYTKSKPLTFTPGDFSGKFIGLQEEQGLPS